MQHENDYVGRDPNCAERKKEPGMFLEGRFGVGIYNHLRFSLFYVQLSLYIYLACLYTSSNVYNRHIYS